MKTLFIERSTGECRDGNWVRQLDLEGVERIVVGTGPGSFAGIRAGLAFAQGYQLGCHCEVLGLPSACAVYANALAGFPQLGDAARLAVVGDARRGKVWVARFDGYRLEREVFQVPAAELATAVGADLLVVSPDAKRIEAELRETFGERYLGGVLPSAAGLEKFVERNPEILRPEPLPIYLNPAVRDDN